MKVHRIITKPAGAPWEGFFQAICNIQSDARDVVTMSPNKMAVFSNPANRETAQRYRELLLKSGYFYGITRKYLSDNQLDVVYYFDYDDLDYAKEFVDRFILQMYDTSNPIVGDFFNLARQVTENRYTFEIKVEDDEGNVIPYTLPSDLAGIVTYWPFDNDGS